MNIFSKIQLLNFLAETLEPFSVDEATKVAGLICNQKNKDFVRTFISTNTLAFRHSKNDTYISRAGLFTGAIFSISPTPTEIRQGYLFIGHRCVPYVNSETFPHEMTFFFNGKKIKKNIKSFDVDTLYNHYNLFGEEFVPQYLAEDNDNNKKIYEQVDYEEPAELSVHVLDMSSIYWDLHFQHGDRFVATVINWKEGAIKLEYLPQAKTTGKKLEDWKNLLEKGFKQSFELIGPGSSMEEQILFALILEKELLLSAEYGSVEECLETSKKIEIVPYGVESRLWFSDSEIPVSGPWQPPTVEETSENELENLFSDIDLVYSESLILCYVIDSLYRKELDTKTMLVRLIPSTVKAPNEKIKPIKNKTDAIHKALSSTYNVFTDIHLGALRNRIVELHSSVTGFLHYLNEQQVYPEELPTQPFVTLIQLYKHLTRLMETRFSFFEKTENITESEEQNLDDSLEGMEESYIETKTSILDFLRNHDKKNSTPYTPKTFKPKSSDIKLRLSSEDSKTISVIITDKCKTSDLINAIKLAFDPQNQYDYKLLDLNKRIVNFLLFVSDPKTGYKKTRNMNCMLSSGGENKIISISYDGPFIESNTSLDQENSSLFFLFEEEKTNGFSKETCKKLNIKLRKHTKV